VGRQPVVLQAEDWAWTGYKTAPEFLKPGDILYVHVDNRAASQDRAAGQDQVAGQPAGPPRGSLRATLEEDSGAEGSLMAIDNVTGDVMAMVGGRDFNLSQYNRAIQAERQVGSAFKPYVYTAAVEAGVTPGETIFDGPTSFGSYSPHDFEGNFLGNISVLKAFADSRNVPAVKLAERVGMRKVIDTAHAFGITSNIPPYLPVALGAVEITLAQQVAAYAVFPNDGMRIAPRLIRRITSADGVPLQEDTPGVVEVIKPRVARTMTTLLEEVTRTGTAAEAARLHHPLGGKTGTTSGFTDAWFLGFSPSVTCGVWVGYDNRLSLGDKETGARAALPIWMDFMVPVVSQRPDERFPAEASSGRADIAP
jgi:penicillin-binding protein 1A